jgi:transposase
LEAQERAAVRLLKKGHTAVYAARHKDVQVHPSTVQRWAKKHGIELVFPHNRHEGREDLVDTAEIIRLRRRRNGRKPMFTMAVIAELCSCSQSYVKKVCAGARREGKL